MSGLRISVEHAFGKIMNYWAYTGYKRGMKIGISPVGAYYIVSVLLSNTHTCIYGSQMASQFGLSPPTPEEYLAL
jgi:hypothetical protein